MIIVTNRIKKNIYSEINHILGSNLKWRELDNLGLSKDYLEINNLKFNDWDMKLERSIYEGKWVNVFNSQNNSEDYFVYHILDIPINSIENLIFSGRMWKKTTLELFAARLTPDALDFFWEKVKDNRICKDYFIF